MLQSMLLEVNKCHYPALDDASVTATPVAWFTPVLELSIRDLAVLLSALSRCYIHTRGATNARLRNLIVLSRLGKTPLQ